MPDRKLIFSKKNHTKYRVIFLTGPPLKITSFSR